MWSVKILVFILVCFILIQQLRKISLEDLDALYLHNSWYLLLAVLLVLPNWGLEFLKWFVTVRAVDHKTSTSNIIRSLFAGISTGFVTPNRLGNFIGRMLYFKGRSRSFLILGTLYGNLAQFLASFFFGLIGFFHIAPLVLYADEKSYIAYSGFILGGLSILLYILFPFLPIEDARRFKRRYNVLVLFRKGSKRLVLPLLLLSLFRYLIFVMQFSLLLVAFGAEYTHELIYALYLHYVIVTLIPSVLMGKLVVRETVGLLVLGSFIPDKMIIVAASLCLWLINLAFPALLGLYFLFKSKYQK